MSTPQAIVERSLSAGSANGEHVVIIDDACATHLRWADNSPTSNGSIRSQRFTAIAAIADAVGTVSWHGAIDEETAVELMARAEVEARQAPRAADSRPLHSGCVDADWGLAPATTSPRAFEHFVPALSDAFAHARRRGSELHGYAENRTHTTYLGTSTGLFRRHAQPTGIVDFTARRPRDGATSWAGINVADLGEADPRELADRIEVRLAATEGRRSLPPGRYEVLLPPSCVADLMLHLYGAAGGQEALDGLSVFSGTDGGTRVGDRLTEAPLTLRSDPNEPLLECAPFVVARSESAGRSSVFDNGLPLSPTTWVDGGVLTSLVHTRGSAHAAAQPVTPEIDNLVLSGPQSAPALDDMIQSTGRGLLLTSLWYLRDVDPASLLLTGVTRDGVYLVEDGAIRCEVNNFRFNESPVDLMRRVVEIGRTERTLPREWSDGFTRMAMPSLRVEGLTFSAVSGA